MRTSHDLHSIVRQSSVSCILDRRTNMERRLALLVAAGFCLAMGGCGGCSSNSSLSTMRARALAASDDEDPAAESVAAQPTAVADSEATPAKPPAPEAIPGTANQVAAPPMPPPAESTDAENTGETPPAEFPAFLALAPALASLDAPPEPATPEPAAPEPAPVNAEPASGQPVEAAPVIDAATLLGSAIDTPGKLPVPDAESLDRSRQLLKQLYGDEVAAARKPAELAKVVTKLLSEAANVEATPADFYELVRIAGQIAARGGDHTNALRALDMVEQKFAVNRLAVRLETLSELSKAAREPTQGAALAAKAKETLLLAMQADDYETVDRSYDLLVAFTRIKGDKLEVQKVAQLRAALDAARQAFEQVPPALKVLEANHHDAQACETVGRYVCLVKNRWEQGLPLLARGADIKLRVLAEIDLELARSPQETLDLADQYWDLAASHKQPFQRGLHFRACQLYQAAISQLASGLDKLRAQKRVDEARSWYGHEEVLKAINPSLATSHNPLPSDS
jgi:hypothetical protein